MWGLIFVLMSCLVGVRAQTNYYMDQPSGCGKYVRVGETSIYIHGQSKVPPGNPPRNCLLYIQTDSTDSKYKLEVTIQSLYINDCGIKMEIFDHQQEFGKHLRSLGCGSKSTDTMYSSGRYITLKLTRTSNLYHPDYDFTIRIRAYNNEDEIGGTSRVNKIGVEVIIPVIILILLLIFVAIILCCCYRQGRLPGMHGRKPRKSASMSDFDRKSTGGEDNPSVFFTPGENRRSVSEKNGLGSQNSIAWSTLTSSDTTKDPVTGRQRGRSALMSQSSPVPPPPPMSGQTEVRQSYNYSPQNSNKLYRKNDPTKPSYRGQDIEGSNVDSYLQSKGVKIGIYPEDSLKRRNMGSEGEGYNKSGRHREDGRKTSNGEMQGKSRDSYAEDDVRKRGSYAEAQERSRGSYAEAQGRDYGSEHISRREASHVEAENDKVKGRKTSPSRRSSSPGGRGNSPSRKGPSTNKQGSSSPGRRRSPGEKRRNLEDQSREKGNADAPPEGKLKRPSSGFFDNPDEEGYIYSYDHLYPGEEGDVSGSTQPGESPKAQHSRGRRGSAAVEFEEDEDGYLLVHNDSKSKPRGKDKAGSKPSDSKSSGTRQQQQQSDGTSYETIEMNPGQNGKSTNSRKVDASNRGDSSEKKGAIQPPNKNIIPELEDTFDENARYLSVDELSEPTETETMSNPLLSNPAVKTRLESSKPLGDAESQPARKKRSANERKPMDDNVSEAGSVRYGIPPSAMQGNQGSRERLDSYPYTVGPSAAYNTIAPRTTESMGPHGQSFISAFENHTPNGHNSPAQVAGKAAWYVQTTPSRKGPVTHGTFVMQTTSRQPSQEELENRDKHASYGESPNRFPDHLPSGGGSSHKTLHPASSSTPNSNNHRSTFNSHQHFSPIEKAERTPNGYHPGPGYHRNPNVGNVTNPRTAMVPNQSSQTPSRYADPGTSIFDEPGHRAAVMRSGIDPNTGNEVNQVVWTDTIPDPTDPVGPNPAVTRKTITRITTRAGHGDIPDPDSMTSQLSFETYADRLSGPQPNDPPFLSPSTGQQRYGGNPRVPEPTPGQEYPGDENVAFYLGLQGQSNKSSRVHQPQIRNHAIRDKIALPTESVA